MGSPALQLVGEPVARGRRKRRSPPTASELAAAARELHRQLGQRLDDAAWAPGQPVGRALRATVHEFAERSTLPRLRRERAQLLAYHALLYVRSALSVHAAIGLASNARGDNVLGDFELDLKAARAPGPGRTEASRWQSVYCLLADGADVDPRADRTRGQRGLSELYAGAAALLNCSSISSTSDAL